MWVPGFALLDRLVQGSALAVQSAAGSASTGRRRRHHHRHRRRHRRRCYFLHRIHRIRNRRHLKDLACLWGRRLSLCLAAVLLLLSLCLPVLAGLVELPDSTDFGYSAATIERKSAYFALLPALPARLAECLFK